MRRQSTKLWGGRFASEPARIFIEYSQSIETDVRMAAQDVWGSQAHVLMLGRQGILTEEEVREILRHLERARERIDEGKLRLSPSDEDIHMNLEKYVIKGAGAEFGGKMHTARSRNDQVVTDCRLYLRDRLLDVSEGVSALQEALLYRAGGHERTVLPGYTHTQHAQPVSVAFWLTGHVSALMRDQARLMAAFDRADACPLGACALAGTSFPTDRRMTARLLGFARVEEHALDAVGSRDFVLEALAALAILHSNLSRICEELVLFSTHEFGMIELADEYTSGSSIMPQKKNPCLAELARARTGEMYGRLVQALTMTKALISGYNRDIQEDKPALWDALDLATASLAAVTGMIGTMELRMERMRELVGANFATATELANWLVSERGLPFRKCHEIVGSTVRRLIEEGKTLGDTNRVIELLADHDVPAEPDELRFLDPLKCLERQRSLGSTGARSVTRMRKRLSGQVKTWQQRAEKHRLRIAKARQTTAEAVAHVLKGGSLSGIDL